MVWNAKVIRLSLAPVSWSYSSFPSSDLLLVLLTMYEASNSAPVMVTHATPTVFYFLFFFKPFFPSWHAEHTNFFLFLIPHDS